MNWPSVFLIVIIGLPKVRYERGTIVPLPDSPTSAGNISNKAGLTWVEHQKESTDGQQWWNALYCLFNQEHNESDSSRRYRCVGLRPLGQYLEILFQTSINNRHAVRVYVALREWSLRQIVGAVTFWLQQMPVTIFRVHYFPEESKYVTYNQQTAPSQRAGPYKSRLVLIAHTDCCMRPIYSYHSRAVERKNGPSNTNVTIWIQGVLGKGDGTYERYTCQQRAWKETSASRFGIVRYQHMYSFVRQSNGLKIKGATVQYLPARTPVSESWAIVFILPLKHVIISRDHYSKDR